MTIEARPEGDLRIFVSYDSASGSDYADAAYEGFRRRGATPWVWHRDHGSGAPTLTEIANHIDEADYVLFICTAGTRESWGQDFEINNALESRKRPLVLTPDRSFVPPVLRGFNHDVYKLDAVDAACERLFDQIRGGFSHWQTVNSHAVVVDETTEVQL